MDITGLDHLVLTVADIERTLSFYESVLGMQRVVFGAGRFSLRCGQLKINLHQAGREFEPKAAHPLHGSADLCFVTALPLAKAMANVAGQGVKLIAGPLPRTGALGPMRSFYFRDPDGNLLEVCSYEETDKPAP